MIINVKVKPNSIKNKFVKIEENEYIVEIKEPAENNRANVSLLKMLSKEFGVSYKKVKIKNPNSRKKIVEIDDK